MPANPPPHATPLPARLRRWAAIAVAPLAAACSPAALVNGLTPSDGYTLERGVAYGDDPRQAMDIYRPDDPRPGAPVIVFFYGGRWSSGERASYRFVGQAFASRGFTTVIPDYRLYPEVRWRGFLSDGADAVAAVRARLAGPDGPPALVLAGHSAGAYIAAMLTLDRHWLERAGVPPDAVAGLVGLSGPYDFLPLREADLKEIFGPGEAGRDTQPVTFAGPGAPPAFLATGERDTTVLPRNSRRLAAELQGAGVPARLEIYPGLGHVTLVGALAAPLHFLANVLEDVTGFVETLPSGQAAGNNAGGRVFTSSDATRIPAKDAP